MEYNNAKYGFISKDKFRRKLNISSQEAENIINANTSYQVHSQAKPNYIHITPEHAVYQCDLMFLDKYKKYNSNYNGILNIIEIGTRYVFSYPFKTKSEAEMKVIFTEFINDVKRLKKDITRIESDGGPEFINKSVQAILKNNNIEFTLIAPFDSRKKGIVERFNQTLRNYIERYLTEEDKPRWIDVLPYLVYNYNHTYHKTMKTEPANIDKSKEAEIKNRLLTDNDNRKAINAFRKININDQVRVLIRKKDFEKGRRLWSKEIYTIASKVPDSYRFKLSNGKEYKYDEIQVIKGGKTILENPEVTNEYATQAHTRRLNKEGIFNNITETRTHIDTVKPIVKTPEVQVIEPRRSTRARKQTDFLRF